MYKQYVIALNNSESIAEGMKKKWRQESLGVERYSSIRCERFKDAGRMAGLTPIDICLKLANLGMMDTCTVHISAKQNKYMIQKGRFSMSLFFGLYI